MKRFLPSGVLLFAGILGFAAITAHSDQDVTKIKKKFDLREAILRKFFRDNDCPAEKYSAEFLREADYHHLDWRLLPSLSFVESGAGKQLKGNNLFGWANGGARFHSMTEAIHQVAEALDTARPYKGKDIFGKLSAYNQNDGYKSLVMNVMRQISPNSEVSGRTFAVGH